MQAAKAAGMKCIAVPELHADLSLFGEADLVVESLEKIGWRQIHALEW